jgi:hypothetical protein
MVLSKLAGSRKPGQAGANDDATGHIKFVGQRWVDKKGYSLFSKVTLLLLSTTKFGIC